MMSTLLHLTKLMGKDRGVKVDGVKTHFQSFDYALKFSCLPGPFLGAFFV